MLQVKALKGEVARNGLAGAPIAILFSSTALIIGMLGVSYNSYAKWHE